MITNVLSLKEKVSKQMDDLKVGEALQEIFEILRKCNKYIDDTMPWSLAKDETKKGRLGTVLYNLLESIRISAVLLTPFLPNTVDKIFQQLNTNVINIESTLSFGGLKAGEKLGEPVHLFERVENK